MNTNDSHKLRHSAMVKNASPHMNGGGPHTQVQKRPVVTTNDGTVVKRPNAPAMVARPVKKIRMGDDGSPQREVEVSAGGGGGGKPQVESEGLNKYGKRMIKVRMDNGKPKADNGNTPGGRMQRVALPGRKSPKNDPRYANLRAQRDQRALAAPVSARTPIAIEYAPAASPMSNEQLMLCLYAVKKYAESETNELIQAQCTLTMRTLDKLLTLHQGQPGAQVEEPVEAEVMEIDPNAVEIDVQGETYDDAPVVQGRGQSLEPNKLSPDQYSELEQFENEQQQAKIRTAQGNVKPFAARAPAKPAPIDTEPDESNKSE